MKMSIEEVNKKWEFFRACKESNIYKIKNLIRTGTNVNKRIGTITALHYVSFWYKDTRVPKLLIDEGIDVNAKDNSGSTALFNACYYEHDDLVRVLIDNGAEVNLVTRWGGESPLSICRQRKHKEIEKMLIEAGAKE